MSNLSATIATAGASFETPKLNLIKRIKALLAGRARRTEANDVAAFIESHGGVLTDNLEREISQRFGRMAGR